MSEPKNVGRWIILPLLSAVAVSVIACGGSSQDTDDNGNGGAVAVVSTDPADGATDVALTGAITITFNTAVDTLSGSVSVQPPPAFVSGTWANNRELSLAHAALAAATTYTVTVRNYTASGYTALPPYEFSFTTADDGGGEETPLTVTATSPTNGAPGVLAIAPIVIDFSHAVSNPDGGAVDFTPTLAGITRSWSNDGRRLTLAHAAFASNQMYQVSVSGFTGTGVTAMAPYSFSFTSVTVDPTKLSVVATSPAAAATGVAVSAAIVITFSDAVNNKTTGTIVGTPALANAVLTWSDGDTKVTVAHDNLTADTDYSITVSGFTAAGKTVMNNHVLSFRTAPGGGPTSKLTVATTDPATDATGIGVTAPIVITFDAAVNNKTTGTITGAPALANAVLTWSEGDTKVSVAHDALTAATSYTITVSGFTAATKTQMDSYQWSFTTKSQGGGQTVCANPGNPVYYCTNPTLGTKVTTAPTIDGHNGGEWTDSNLIAIDMTNDDPRSLGDAWTMNNEAWDITHLWASWDATYLYIAFQYTNVTDVIDPVNANQSMATSTLRVPIWIAIDTIEGQGASKDMFPDKNIDADKVKQPYWTGTTLPDYEIGMGGDLSWNYIARAIAGVFAKEAGETDYKTFAATGIVAAVANETGAPSLWGVSDADDALTSSPTLRDFKLESSHVKSGSGCKDSFYEMKIPLAAIGNPNIEANGIGLMIGQEASSGSALDTIPNDSATSDTKTQVNAAPGEWVDVDNFKVGFARVGAW